MNVDNLFQKLATNKIFALKKIEEFTYRNQMIAKIIHHRI